MQCSNCQSDNPEGINFCASCGLPLNVRLCPACAFENPPLFKFCGNCGVALGGEVSNLARRDALARQERRQLTVLFCDLVDSTRLSRLMDPEDLLAIFENYRNVCTQHIDYYGGTVARFIGDGVLAYFGYPQAHEDDAERAVQAGLRIIEEIPALNGRFGNPEEVPIAVRIGAATGLTVVGDIAGPGASEFQSATGETLNLAARIQSLASPNSLVIPLNTYRLVGGLFRCEDLGYHLLKGFDHPIKAWRVVEEMPGESRFEATHRASFPPLVDRVEEREILRRRWQEVREGKGQVVLLAGDAGIGKSRLVQMLVDSIDLSDNTRLGFQCYPYYSNSPYHPLLRSLQGKAGLSSEKPRRVNFGRLRRLLSGDSAARDEAMASIWPLFENIAPAVEGGKSELPDGISKLRLHEVLLDQVRRMARARPVVMVIEDLHWIDPSSADLLEELIQGISDLPILCMLTCRPQYQPAWSGLSTVTHISLDSLDQKYRRQLVYNLCRDRQIPEKLIDLIADKTDGVPLFIEEVTKTFLDSGDDRPEGSRVEDGMSQHLAIPSTLQDSLIARLDRLGPVKIVAQVASVAGRSISRTILQRVLGWKSTRLDDAVNQLVGAELMVCHGEGQDASYEFRHALTGDAAYEGMLRRKRATLHLEVGVALEAAPASIHHAEPEILAYHFAEAARYEKQPELLLKSAEYWLEAGLRSNRQSAYRESEKQLRQGIDVLQQCTHSLSRQRLERDLQTALGNVLIQNEGPGSAAVSAAFARAAELSLDRAGEITDAVREFAIKWGQWRTCLDIPRSKRIVDEMLDIASGGHDADLLLEAYHAQWPTCFYLGELKHCCSAVAHGLEIYREDRHVDHRAFFGGHDTRVCGHGQAALANWLLGQVDESAGHIRSAVELAHDSDHKPSVAHALDYDVMLSYMMGDRARTRRIADELYELSSEQKFPDYRDRARTFLGWCLVYEGQVADGLQELEKGLAAQRRVGTQEDFEVFRGMYAECLLQAGNVDAAADEYRMALHEASERCMLYWQGELSRRIGRLAQRQGDPEVARSSLLRSIELNEAQGAIALLLPALQDFIELFPDVAEAQRARLAQLYAEYPRLFDHPNFSAILASLRAGAIDARA